MGIADQKDTSELCVPEPQQLHRAMGIKEVGAVDQKEIGGSLV